MLEIPEVLVEKITLEAHGLRLLEMHKELRHFTKVMKIAQEQVGSDWRVREFFSYAEEIACGCCDCVNFANDATWRRKRKIWLEENSHRLKYSKTHPFAKKRHYVALLAVHGAEYNKII